MGLDQYAWACNPAIYSLEADIMATDRDPTEEELSVLSTARIEICKWRKHADLNAYMTELYVRKGGVGEFNCEKLLLTRDDLLSLKHHIEEHNGYENRGEGFFWGATHPEDIERDKQFIKDALRYIDEGFDIYYYCWY
jgi:hypothetical protein